MKRQIKKDMHIPLWKRCMLVTGILLGAGPFVTIAINQPAYASAHVQGRHHHSHAHHKNKKKKKEVYNLNINVSCQGGTSGSGGRAVGNSSGANGGNGGNCNFTIPHNFTLTIQSHSQPDLQANPDTASDDAQSQ